MASDDYVPPEWVKKGQRVRCLADPGIAGQSMYGRTGNISRIINAVFTDHCYVTFPKQGREQKDRERMMQIDRLEPLDE